MHTIFKHTVSFSSHTSIAKRPQHPPHTTMGSDSQSSNCSSYRRITSDNKNNGSSSSSKFLQHHLYESEQAQKAQTVLHLIVDYIIILPLWTAIMLFLLALSQGYKHLAAAINFKPIRSCVQSVIASVNYRIPILRDLIEFERKIAAFLTNPRNRKLIPVFCVVFVLLGVILVTNSSLLVEILCGMAVWSTHTKKKALRLENEKMAAKIAGLKKVVERLSKEKEEAVQAGEEEWDAVIKED
jgi:hypothetical protein